MSKQFIELDNRVFSVEVTPDTPGELRRTLCVAVESGPMLTLEEYKRLSAAVVAEFVARRCVIHGWRAVEEGGDR